LPEPNGDDPLPEEPVPPDPVDGLAEADVAGEAGHTAWPRPTPPTTATTTTTAARAAARPLRFFAGEVGAAAGWAPWGGQPM
jgi:hypothetical protein